MKPLLFSVLLFLPTLAPAQTDDGTWEELMQQLAEGLVEDDDEQQWRSQQELLEELHEHPLDINSATRDQLLSLPFLTEQAADGILDYIALNGPMRSLGELRLVRQIDLRQREWLHLFVCVPPYTATPRSDTISWWGRSRHELLARADVPLYKRAGWPWARGIANRWRYTWQQGRHLDVGLRAETDAGEPMFARTTPLWDSYGGHILLKDIGPLRSLIVGDFKAGFGEGLVMNNGLLFGKLTMGLWRTAGGIRPHRSAEESDFLRGAAATLAFGRLWKLTALYSYRRLDATVAADSSVQAINASGLHRTASELARRATLGSHAAAVHLTMSRRPFGLGLTALYQHYDHVFRQSASLYRQILPEGSQFGAAGVDYRYSSSRFYVAGETARSFSRAANGNGWSTLNKAAWRFSPASQLAVIQRFYSKHYHSPYASAYGENSHVQNESGVALQLDADRLGPFSLRTFFDFFYSPWPRYTMTRYSTGWEGALQINYPPQRGRNILLRYSIKSKEQSDLRHYAHRLRATYTHTFSGRWSAAFSAFFHGYKERGSKASLGFALTPRADYTSADQRLRLTLFAALFRTDSYDSRIYVYEPSLFQSFGLQQLYGFGQRLAATLRLSSSNTPFSRALRWLLQAKVGITHYSDRSTISSGPLQIGSSWKADIQLLLRLQIR